LESPLSGTYFFSGGFFVLRMISGIATNAAIAATFHILIIGIPVETLARNINRFLREMC
jgi:hypothetical protein